MNKIRQDFMFDLDVIKGLNFYKEKTGISKSMIANSYIREGLKNHSKELKEFFIDEKNLLSEIKEIQQKDKMQSMIEKQKDLIRVATLFKETLNRLKILNDCRMTRTGIMLFINNEIDILSLYDVVPSIKNHYLRFFKKIRIELNKQKTNDDFKKILDKLLTTFEQMIKTVSISDEYIKNSDNFKYKDRFPDDNDKFLDYKK